MIGIEKEADGWKEQLASQKDQDETTHTREVAAHEKLAKGLRAFALAHGHSCFLIREVLP